MPDVMVHIGPHKTGSTSIQGLLRANLPALRSAGIDLPLVTERLTHHWPAAVELLAGDPDSHLLDWDRRMVADNPTRIAGSWPALVGVTQRSELPTVIWSSESFAGASTASVRRVTQALGRPLHTVVVVSRPASGILPSLYQEHAKRSLVPEFDTYVRQHLTALLDERPGRVAWLDVAWVLRAWTPHARRVELVRPSSGFGAASIAQAVAILSAGSLVAPTDHPRRNTSLTAAAVVALQRSLRAQPPRYGGAARRALKLTARTEPAATDPALGGSFRLAPELAHAVDATWPPDGTAGDPAARAEVRRRLAATAPVGELIVPDPAGFAAEVARIERRLRARMTRLDRLYRAATAVAPRRLGGPYRNSRR